jgi:hypothetical protein
MSEPRFDCIRLAVSNNPKWLRCGRQIHRLDLTLVDDSQMPQVPFRHHMHLYLLFVSALHWQTWLGADD